MKRKEKKRISKIIIFFILLSGILFQLTTSTNDIINDIKLGLDLQGGFEVLYEVLPLDKHHTIDEQAMNSTVEALRKRIDVLGVSEPIIQLENDNRIRIQLAGIREQNEARNMISAQAKLSFRDTNDRELLTGLDLKEGGAHLAFGDLGQPWVGLTLNNPKKFGEVTELLANKPYGENLLVVWLDYAEGDSFAEEITKENPKFLSAPTVSQKLNNKDVVIQGQFTIEEATQLADLINAGSLPVELKEIYSTSVSAQFGEKALDKTTFAAIVALTVIFAYMIAYYRLPGIISVITLSAYVYLILLFFGLASAVLTLPGIAALILGVGMAVDANILMFERIKEEIRKGKTLHSSFLTGNKKAIATIIDSNLTTLIAASVLFYLGTSSVKGFALMLIVSILVSFFTVFFGTRSLLGLWVKSGFLNKKPTFFGVKEEQINEL